MDTNLSFPQLLAKELEGDSCGVTSSVHSLTDDWPLRDCRVGEWVNLLDAMLNSNARDSDTDNVPRLPGLVAKHLARVDYSPEADYGQYYYLVPVRAVAEGAKNIPDIGEWGRGLSYDGFFSKIWM